MTTTEIGEEEFTDDEFMSPEEAAARPDVDDQEVPDGIEEDE